MTAQSTLIRAAVIELLEGSIGTVRTVPIGAFGFGVFDGQPQIAQQARSIDARYRHRFDVVIGSARPHKATPMTGKADHRIEARAITIRVSSALGTSADDVTRLAIRDAVEQDCADAIGALCYPGNLTTTRNGEATGIASGILVGTEDGSGFPRWEVQSEDWKRQLLVSRIMGIAIVNVAQAVA